jgi:hypothetical protein
MCWPCRVQTPAAARLLIIDRISSDSAIQFRQLPTRASTSVDENQPSWPLSPSPQCASTSTIPSDMKHYANALWGCRYRPFGKPSSLAMAPSPEPTPRSPLLPPPRRFRAAPSSCAKPAALSSFALRLVTLASLELVHLIGSLLHPSPAISELVGVDTSRPGEVPPFLSLSHKWCAKLAGAGHGVHTVCSSEEKKRS